MFISQLEEVFSERDHNHVGDTNLVRASKLKNDMNQIAGLGRSCPHQILADALVDEPVVVRAVIGKMESVKRTLRRHKRGTLPLQPKSLQDLVLDEEWQKTRGEDSVSFLIYDSGPERADRLMIFATDEALTRLGSSRQWFMDGTFGCAPALFQQLYVIRVPLGQNSISCVYAFMSTKTIAAYEELFRAITDKCRLLGFDVDPQCIVMDFEQAVISAVRNVFGLGVRISGCFFHLCQSTWRKIQELGLVQKYKESADIRHFCGMLDGLAFLPVCDVTQGLGYLKSVVPDGLVPLVEYFDSTYVSGPMRALQQPITPNAIGGVRLRLRRAGPNFPPAIWNVNEATINDEARTNNICEAWNNSFRVTVGHSHPCVWKSIQAIRKDQAISSTLMYQYERGEPETKRVRRETKELQGRLKKLCTEYRDGIRNMHDFLRAVGHCVRVF